MVIEKRWHRRMPPQRKDCPIERLILDLVRGSALATAMHRPPAEPKSAALIH